MVQLALGTRNFLAVRQETVVIMCFFIFFCLLEILYLLQTTVRHVATRPATTKLVVQLYWNASRKREGGGGGERRAARGVGLVCLFQIQPEQSTRCDFESFFACASVARRLLHVTNTAASCDQLRLAFSKVRCCAVASRRAQGDGRTMLINNSVH